MKIHTSLHAYNLICKKARNDIEEFWVLSLNSELKVVSFDLIFRGTANRCLVHPRDIFLYAIKTNAVKIIIAHTHPSGNSKPSVTDLQITHQLIKAGQLLQIPILDHLIITKSHYTSLANENEELFSII